MEKISNIRKEFEDRFTMGSYEKYIWEFIEEKLKNIMEEEKEKVEQNQ